MATASQTARPRRWRLEFSLRLLLVAMLAFAIGFPLWYRWPYEEKTPVPRLGDSIRVTTWQRQWGGEPLKHGPETLLIDGKVRRSTAYVRGRKHGPHIEYRADGVQIYAGQFVDGRMEGSWIDRDLWTDLIEGTCRAHWHAGRRHGPLEMAFPDGLTAQAWFHQGRVTHYKSQCVSSRLWDLLDSGAIDVSTSESLRRNVALDWKNRPLADLASWGTSWGIPLIVDPYLPERERPITERIIGVDLCAALTMITSPRGLVCDYRYGCVWVTTAEDACHWRDPTGVTEVRTGQCAALDGAWSKPAIVRPYAGPLSQLLESLSTRLAVDIDVSQIECRGRSVNAIPVTFDLDHGYTPGAPVRSLKDVLGIVLYQTGCRCELDGDTLVILPPDTPTDKQE